MKSFLKGILAIAVLLLCVAFGHQFAQLQERLSGPAIDQRVQLKPQLMAAVDGADRAAVETARSKLMDWQKGVMEKVDGEFLDWHFSYYEWRMSGAKWIWRTVTGGKDYADQQFFDEIAGQFAAKVMSPESIDTAMRQIAEATATAYQEKLADGIATVRQASGQNRDLVDVELRNVSVAGRSESGGTIYVSLHDVATRRSMTAKVLVELFKQIFDPKMVQSAPSVAGVSQEAVVLSTTAGVTVAATAKKLGLAKATAAAVGVATSAVCVVAVVAVHEWWSHSNHVNEHRPRLRRLIHESLTEFIEAAVKEDGRFGSRIREVRGQIAASFENQATIWGIVNEKARRALSI